MSIGVIYNVFDGAELLKSSIESIRKHVEEVIVVYQTRSYYGNKIREYNIVDVVEDYVKAGLITKAIHCDFDFVAMNSSIAKAMERTKYQRGLDYLIERSIEYFRCAAADEFFEEGQFKSCIDFVRKNQIRRSFCSIETYSDVQLKDSTQTDTLNANFLYKNLGKGYQFGNSTSPVYIDSVISYGDAKKDHIFNQSEVVMHHHRLTRLDNEIKLNNSSISNKSLLKSQIQNIEKIKKNAQKCDNMFNIDIEEFKRKYYK